MAVKAFPTAEGFGANSVGGRGGQVLFVTNLNDSGPGSLRAAIDASGPRTIIFRVGGTISLNSNLTIQNPFCTIAGQTAPGGGIALKNYQLTILRTHDVIVRFIRSRVGADAIDLTTSLSSGRDTNAILIYSGDPFGWTKTYNIIVDHCTAGWANDQHMDAYGYTQDITYQWCLVHEGILFGHSQNNQSAHITGSHLGSQPVATVGGNHDPIRTTVHHCLYANVNQRMPLTNNYPGVNNTSLMARYDFCNNILYDRLPNGAGLEARHGNYTTAAYNAYLAALGSASAMEFNVIGTYWRSGPQSTSLSCGYIGTGTRLFCQDNINDNVSMTPSDGLAVLRLDKWEGSEEGTISFANWGGYNPTSPYNHVLAARFSVPNPVTLTPASQVFDTVLNNVGPAFVVRNGVVTSIRDTSDARVVANVRNRTGEPGVGITWDEYVNGGQRFPYPTIANGTPYLDSNLDGIQDGWAGMPVGATAQQIAPNGYTYLENFINEMAGDIAPVSSDTIPPAPPTGVTVS